MITKPSYSKDWIISQSIKIGKADPSLLEYGIYAFSLLEHLVSFKLNFIFKGGTALLLLLPEQRRFSTDVDILCTADKKDIEAILDEICKDSVFTHWLLDDRRSYQPGIPKAHYKLFFNSELEDQEKELMLDILIEKSEYPELVSREILLPWFQGEGATLSVSIPSAESILGDKLCAFGPNTIGVPYNANKDKEIVKQLFDINFLASYITNIDIVAQSFKTIAAKEISYRPQAPVTIEEVYSDIRNTALMMAYGYREKFSSYIDREKYYAIENGRGSLKSYIIGPVPKGKESVLLAATQAAYITTLIQLTKTDAFALFDGSQDIEKYLFAEAPWSTFNRLIKLPGGILYYLKNTLDLLK